MAKDHSRLTHSVVGWGTLQVVWAGKVEQPRPDPYRAMRYVTRGKENEVVAMQREWNEELQVSCCTQTLPALSPIDVSVWDAMNSLRARLGG